MSRLTTFLERIVQRQSSFVLFGGRVYELTDTSNRPDFLDVAGARMDLAPSLTFAEFESLDEQVQAEGIQRYCSEYVRDTISRELKSESELSREKNRVRALQYIMTEFLPFFLSRKYNSDDMLLATISGEDDKEAMTLVELAKQEIATKLSKDFGTGEDEKTKDLAEEMKQNVIKRERREMPKDPMIAGILKHKQFGMTKKQIPESVLGELIADQPLLICGGTPYQLMPAKDVERTKNGGMKININGREYLPVNDPLPTLKEISGQLLERKLKKWRLDALERSEDAFQEIKDRIKTFEVSERQMRELAKLKEYDLGDCGFLLKDGMYYVYARTPKFATQDGRDVKKFWPFEATRVSIKIGWENGQYYSTDYPYVVERREFHPCLKDRKRSEGFCSICNLNREPGQYRNETLDLVRKLSDAVNVVLEPLNKPSLDSHSGHSYFGDHLDEILKQGHLTRKDAERQGYMIVEVIAKDVGK